MVPSTVFTEVCMLAERRRGTRAELAFLADVRAGLLTLLESTSADLDRIAEFVATYADLPLGTVGASVIALTELKSGQTRRVRPAQTINPNGSA
ncbi:MAG: hypothetical protein J0I49_28405 [Pseudonocardia sp.]|uniref:hypothetical protein n=1 Tax=Pseudonocardia sp. TaxID=60912 RepID=UPI001ACFE207|nr:hypothetical protein [Pseudonocardia sp.]MBN9101989.1 hypothetical protein [Pseudonocardia sp.]